MKRIFYSWIDRPAKWWQFWRPQSGVFGGGVSGVLFVGALVLIWRLIIER